VCISSYESLSSFMVTPSCSLSASLDAFEQLLARQVLTPATPCPAPPPCCTQVAHTPHPPPLSPDFQPPVRGF
jgi:hypothetical protein